MIISTYQPFFAPFSAFFAKAYLSDMMIVLDKRPIPSEDNVDNQKSFLKTTKESYGLRSPVSEKKGLGSPKN